MCFLLQKKKTLLNYLSNYNLQLSTARVIYGFKSMTTFKKRTHTLINFMKRRKNYLSVIKAKILLTFQKNLHNQKSQKQHNSLADNKLSNLRRARLFVKSRFARNRQWCRPIVIWSLWFNIAFMFFSLVTFYGIKLNIGYMPYLVLLPLIMFVLIQLPYIIRLLFVVRKNIIFFLNTR